MKITAAKLFVSDVFTTNVGLSFRKSRHTCGQYQRTTCSRGSLSKKAARQSLQSFWRLPKSDFRFENCSSSKHGNLSEISSSTCGDIAPARSRNLKCGNWINWMHWRLKNTKVNNRSDSRFSNSAKAVRIILTSSTAECMGTLAKVKWRRVFRFWSNTCAMCR